MINISNLMIKNAIANKIFTSSTAYLPLRKLKSTFSNSFTYNYTLTLTKEHLSNI